MIEGAVYTPDGLVGLAYYQPIPKLVEIGNKQYYFDAQHGVSLCFVNEYEVPSLLSLQGGCCGNKRYVISLATQGQYNVWATGDR